MDKSITPVFAIVPLLVAGAATAQPLEYELGVTLGAEYHDNINKRPDNEESDIQQTVGLNLGALNTRGRVLFDIGYNLWYDDYADDKQEDRSRYDGTGEVTVRLIEGNLDWYLAHQISEERTDRELADTPDNQERRSIQRTGLDWRLPLGKVTVLTVSPHFVDAQYEDSEGSDSQRVGGSVSLARVLSPTSSVALIGSYDDVEFDDDLFDYESTTGKLNYSVELARTSYVVEAGYTEIDRENFENVDGPVGSLQFDYAGEGFDWGAYLLYELTDSSLGFSEYELSFRSFEADDSNFDDRDVITRATAQVYYTHRFAAGHALRARLSLTEEDYETVPQDEELLNLSVEYSYALTSRWELTPGIFYRKVKFVDDPSGRENDEYDYRLSADYTYSQALGFRFGVGMEERESNVSAQSEYEDFYGFAAVTYNFF